MPIGANTLALYYNKAVLTAAGVDPASVKDWASLDAALAKVKAAGKKGITFSAIGTEEGTFQFLPWFWGAGAALTDLGPRRRSRALTLWKSWLDKGYAPNSVIDNTQTTSWQEFATGEYAFAENGTWQLQNAKKAGFEYGVIADPGRTGGTAPAPTGGEFVTVPAQDDKDTETKAGQIATCLTSPDKRARHRHRADLRLGGALGAAATGCRAAGAGGLGGGGEEREGPHRRQPRHPLPADLAAAVGCGAGRAHRCRRRRRPRSQDAQSRRGVREVACRCGRGVAGTRRLGVPGPARRPTCWCVTPIRCTPTST